MSEGARTAAVSHDHSDRAYEWVGDWSRRRARLMPNRVAVRGTATDEAYTYADVDARANRTARALRALDVEEVVMLAALHDASAYITADEVADVARSLDDRNLRELGEYLQQWADADADWFDDGEVLYTDGEDDRYDQPGHAIYDEVRSRLQEAVFDGLTAPDDDGPDSTGIRRRPDTRPPTAPSGTTSRS